MTIPRIAVGTVQPGADATPAVWSLLAFLEEEGYQVQDFHFRSDVQPCDRVRHITGQGQRHLDSWLMPRELCRELFVLGSQGNDLAVIDGRYDVALRAETPLAAELAELAESAEWREPAGSASLPLAGNADMAVSHCALLSHTRDTRGAAARARLAARGTRPAGGSLDTLCQWLDLPRIVVIDAERWERGETADAPRPVAGVLLDRVTDADQGVRLTEFFARDWGAPVLGIVRRLPELDSRPPMGREGDPNVQRERIRRWAAGLKETFRAGTFWRIAEREETSAWEVPTPLPSLGDGQRLRIAVACDDAFPCSFPDTLDLLEACGAELRAFSPLRSPELPAGTDLVYLGCGQLDQYAEELAANCCLKQSLHSFAMAGGRVYAEGAGLAYLCRQLVTGRGQRYPMVNVLPALASRRCCPGHAEPAVVRFRRSTWLGQAYQELRGYLHPVWRVDAWGTTTNLALEPEHQGNLLGYRNVIGSRLHLNFAAQPHYLSAFFRPHLAEYAPA